MESMVLVNERRLGVPVTQARVLIVRSLRSQGFMLTTEQVSIVAARRGSQLVGAVHPKKLPVTVRVTFETVEGGCRLDIRLADAWKSPGGKVWGMNGAYQQVMAGIQAEFDSVLIPVAWHGNCFESGVMQSGTADVAFLSRGNATIGTTGGVLIAKAEERLVNQPDSGPPKTLHEVVLHGSKGFVSFDRSGVQGLLTVGLLVSMKPGSMPPNLAADVESLSARIETAIQAQPVGRLDINLDDKELPVAEFLAKQASLRDALAVRVLHVCTTCKFEKIVNPDFERLQALNQKKKALTGLVGATISSKGITPFVLVGSLLKLKTTEIAFVCPRCQGLDDDTSIVTFCPQCGERRDEAVLRNCQRCKYAFTAHTPTTDQFWQSEPPPPAEPRLPSPLAAPISAPRPTLTHTSTAPIPPPTATRITPPTLVAETTPTTTRSLPPPTPNEFMRPTASDTQTSQQTHEEPHRPGWFNDCTRRHQHRYWNGTAWTSHVADNGTPTEDPLN